MSTDNSALQRYSFFLLLQLFRFTSWRSDNNSLTDDAFIIDIRLFLINTKITEHGIRYADLLLGPFVCEGFEIAVVIVLAVYFQMDNGPFLLFFLFHEIIISTKV